MTKPTTMAVTVDGHLPPGVSAKDLILSIIARIGTSGAQGHIIEYRGEAIRSLSMEGRMTVCNMSIEAGARAGIIAPDDTTFEYVKGRAYAPEGAAWDDAVARWSALSSDEGARYDAEVHIDASGLSPYVTWGTNPGQALPISQEVPDPESFDSPDARDAARRAIEYMDLIPGTPLREIAVDFVFLGSCTNGRIEDLRAAAAVIGGAKLAPGVRMLVVPGSMAVKAQAEAEGLDALFLRAGAEWRTSGCSMCVGMNDDVLSSGQRCASTSNRNFEGRQGRGALTHLLSPSSAAATALLGHLASPADLQEN